MARPTVKALLTRLEALERRVEELERPRRRKMGFEYEGSVGGDMIRQDIEYLDSGDRGRRG